MSGAKQVLKIAKPPMAEQMQAFKRKRDSLGFGWAKIDAPLLYAALASALENDVAVMFSRAAGGRGVCIRLMKGRNVPAEVEYAFDAEELNGWLEAIVDAYGSPSEDAVLTIRTQMQGSGKAKGKSSAAMSAD